MSIKSINLYYRKLKFILYAIIITRLYISFIALQLIRFSYYFSIRYYIIVKKILSYLASTFILALVYNRKEKFRVYNNSLLTDNSLD